LQSTYGVFRKVNESKLRVIQTPEMNLLADSLFVGTKEMKNCILDIRFSNTSFKKNSMVLEFFRGMRVKYFIDRLFILSFLVVIQEDV